MDERQDSFDFGDDEDEEYHYSDEEESDMEDSPALASAAVGTQLGVEMTTSASGVAVRSPSPSSGLRAGARPAGGGTTVDYRIIDAKELLIEQTKIVEEVANLWNLDFSVACALLRYFSWSKEKFSECYMNNPERTLEEAGLKFCGKNRIALPTTDVDCQICCETWKPKQVFGLGCGHVFCLECWRPYLSFKVEEGPICVTTTCPAHNCNEVVRSEVFERICNEQVSEKYRKYLLRSYVDYNKSIKWCPSPGCDKILAGTDGYLLPIVKCSCGTMFCMRCGESAHLPASCSQVELWQEKCRNESETANWILANTKKCPKCSIRIEKNQGCNHMTCRHCKFEFCWICLGVWNEHGSNTGGYYKCNRFKEAEGGGDSEMEKAKAELDRYLHYYQRYANHQEAEKFAVKMRQETERRMIELQETCSSNSWIDVQFLKNANELLIECRRVLRYTYVAGYYIPVGKEKNLFEYLQENLEKNTEHLTELSEMALDKVQHSRTEIVNFTRVTEKFLNNLLDGVKDGLTSNNAAIPVNDYMTAPSPPPSCLSSSTGLPPSPGQNL